MQLALGVEPASERHRSPASCSHVPQPTPPAPLDGAAAQPAATPIPHRPPTKGRQQMKTNEHKETTNTTDGPSNLAVAQQEGSQDKEQAQVECRLGARRQSVSLSQERQPSNTTTTPDANRRSQRASPTDHHQIARRAARAFMFDEGNFDLSSAAAAAASHSLSSATPTSAPTPSPPADGDADFYSAATILKQVNRHPCDHPPNQNVLGPQETTTTTTTTTNNNNNLTNIRVAQPDRREARQQDCQSSVHSADPEQPQQQHRDPARRPDHSAGRPAERPLIGPCDNRSPGARLATFGGVAGGLGFGESRCWSGMNVAAATITTTPTSRRKPISQQQQQQQEQIPTPSELSDQHQDCSSANNNLLLSSVALRNSVCSQTEATNETRTAILIKPQASIASSQMPKIYPNNTLLEDLSKCHRDITYLWPQAARATTSTINLIKACWWPLTRKGNHRNKTKKAPPSADQLKVTSGHQSAVIDFVDAGHESGFPTNIGANGTRIDTNNDILSANKLSGRAEDNMKQATTRQHQLTIGRGRRRINYHMPESISQVNSTLGPDDYDRALSVLNSDIRFKLHLLLYRRVQTIWTLFSTILCLMIPFILFASLESLIIVGACLAWLAFQLVGAYATRQFKKKLDQMLEKSIAQANSYFLDHNLMLGVINVGSILTRARLLIPMLYFDTSHCREQIESIISIDSRRDADDKNDKPALDYSKIGLPLTKSNSVMALAQSQLAKKIVLRYSQRWISHFDKRKLMFTDDGIKPRHLSTGKCLCQFIEEHFKNDTLDKKSKLERRHRSRVAKIKLDQHGTQTPVGININQNGTVKDEEAIVTKVIRNSQRLTKSKRTPATTPEPHQNDVIDCKLSNGTRQPELATGDANYYRSSQKINQAWIVPTLSHKISAMTESLEADYNDDDDDDYFKLKDKRLQQHQFKINIRRVSEDDGYYGQNHHGVSPTISSPTLDHDDEEDFVDDDIGGLEGTNMDERACDDLLNTNNNNNSDDLIKKLRLLLELRKNQLNEVSDYDGIYGLNGTLFMQNHQLSQYCPNKIACDQYEPSQQNKSLNGDISQLNNQIIASDNTKQQRPKPRHRHQQVKISSGKKFFNQSEGLFSFIATKNSQQANNMKQVLEIC